MNICSDVSRKAFSSPIKRASGFYLVFIRQLFQEDLLCRKLSSSVRSEHLWVNKVCGSGLKSVMLAAQAIQCGDADVVVAGGMEAMSAAPYFLKKARFGYRMGEEKIHDHMVHDGLWDQVNDFHMGISNSPHPGSPGGRKVQGRDHAGTDPAEKGQSRRVRY